MSIQCRFNVEWSPKVWDLCLEHEELLRLADEQVPGGLRWERPCAPCPSHDTCLVLPWVWVKDWWLEKNFWSLLETREVWGEISSHCNLILIHQVHREPPPRNLFERDHSWGCWLSAAVELLSIDTSWYIVSIEVSSFLTKLGTHISPRCRWWTARFRVNMKIYSCNSENGWDVSADSAVHSSLEWWSAQDCPSGLFFKLDFPTR